VVSFIFMIDVNISKESLDISACIAKVTDPECGGIDVFIGTIRSRTEGRKVVRLEYEVYRSMALKELKKIADEAIEQWEIKHLLIHHRTGILRPCDTAVIIAVSAPHRGAAFDACRYAIDALKETVPIWKKEVFEDGEEWVSAHA
jgi:molybdopterin synthase catalytic subunit